MVTPLHRYVRDKLTDDDRLQIVDDYEQFERDGAIDECALRHHAAIVMRDHGAGPATVTVWMRDLAFETYRYYAGIVLMRLRQLRDEKTRG